MEVNGAKDSGVVQSNGVPRTAPNGGRELYVPTVFEALPFTPFGSIVPFNAEIIPPPLATSSVSPTAFAASQDVQTVRRTLEQLSAGASGAEHASRRFQQTLDDVKKLLDPGSLTQFKFRCHRRIKATNLPASNRTRQAPRLSSFAKMIYQDSEVTYRYLTTESPHIKARPAANGLHVDNVTLTPLQPHVKQEVPQANGYPTPSQQVPPHGSQGPMLQAVVVPVLLTPAQRAEYQTMFEADAKAGADHPDPTLTKRHSNLQNGHRAMSVDQKQKGDAVVHSLKSLLSQIFIAEDQLQPGSANHMFAATTHNSDLSPTLQTEIQSKLDAQVQKAIFAGRLENVEVEHLVRAQRLCENAVAAVTSMDLSVSDDWSDDDVEGWTLRLSTAARGLVAARTLMRIASASSQSKELQSEDHLRLILEAIRHVIDTFIIPNAEQRALQWEKTRGGKDQPPANPKFSIAQERRTVVVALLHASTKCVRGLGDFLTRSTVDESALSSVEFICKTLIFAQNATHDRDSIFGLQNFEAARKCAMDVLARMFARYPEQRQFVLDGILISLEKLPATSQSARQFRPLDLKPIQLVSALLMRLVQTSATASDYSVSARAIGDVETQSDEDEDSDSTGGEEDEDEDRAQVSTSNSRKAPEDLISIVKPLHDAAQFNATYIVQVLVHRALGTTKSSEEPYRKLLDIFTEDFLTVLGSSDWPASEMLLRTLIAHMIGTAESSKSPVPSRTLALELLGTIGAGILDLQKTARAVAKSVEEDVSAVSQHLTSMIEQSDTGDIAMASLVALDGPYCTVVEYLRARGADDAQLRSAQSYHLMQWAFLICGGREGSTESDSSETPHSSKNLQLKLRGMILQSQGQPDLADVTTSNGRSAALIITLNSRFCRAFNKIFHVLLTCLNSEQPTIKSRSLKSVVILLEKDPTILDRGTHIFSHIFRCASDASPMVRDSALHLITTCRTLRPALDPKLYQLLIERTKDAAVGVRKRAIKMLKDVYLANADGKMRCTIALAILSCMADDEESVRDLARQTMEEVWFAPFYSLECTGEDAVPSKLQYNAHAALLIETIGLTDDVLKILESLLRDLIRSKTASSNQRACKTLVGVLSDAIIDSTHIPGSPRQDSILRALTVFAKAEPTLFTATQLERLGPYTQNLASGEDLEVYRWAVTILRHTMPHQPMLKKEFLQTLQTALLTSVVRLPISELSEKLGEVVPCLWTINGMLHNIERLVTFVISALGNIHHLGSPQSQPSITKVAKLVIIVGHFGRACDFNPHIKTFKEKFVWYKGDSVADLMVEVLAPLADPRQALEIRQTSLEAICTIAQAWPTTFMRPEVVDAFEAVLREQNPALEEALLDGLESFFCTEDLTKGADEESELGGGIATGADRLGRTYHDAGLDGASTSIAQRFLPQLLRLALSSFDRVAFVAAKIVVSVDRKGIVHPKETAPALIALETCPDPSIANIAFIEHRAQHTKHESLFDKEHMRAVQQAFKYQHEVIGNAAGALGRPPVAKLHLFWQVLKAAKAQGRKKFLITLPQKMSFDLNSQDSAAASLTHLHFVRFCAENLAFFDYDRVDDVMQILSSLEKAFAGTGTEVAQAIETDILQIRVNQEPKAIVDGNEPADVAAAKQAALDVDPTRLYQLAIAAQICSIIFETTTFLRRLWNMQKYASKTKTTAKESTRAPTRATNAPALVDAYLQSNKQILTQSSNPDTQREMCASFLEIISVDSEVKIAADRDEDASVESGYDTPSENMSGKSPSAPPSGGAARGRKRKAGSAAVTPRKRGRPRKSSSAKFAMDDDDDEGGWD